MPDRFQRAVSGGVLGGGENGRVMGCRTHRVARRAARRARNTARLHTIEGDEATRKDTAHQRMLHVLLARTADFIAESVRASDSVRPVVLIGDAAREIVRAAEVD